MAIIIYADFGCPYCYLASLRADQLLWSGIAEIDWRAVTDRRGLVAVAVTQFGGAAGPGAVVEADGTPGGPRVGADDLGPVSRNAGSVADNVGRRAAPVSVNLGWSARSSPVELDLVQPLRPVRRRVDQFGELRLNPRRQRGCLGAA